MTGTPPRILLVEDNDTTARTLRVFLEAQACLVERVSGGMEAERVFDAGAFDLVVLDLMLPDISGIDVCRALRARSAVPIVMLTARAAEDDVVRGLESGADDYVTKPFSARALLARIRRCLDRACAAADTRAVLQHGRVEMDVERRIVRVDGAPVKLTRSEFDLLHHLLRRPGRVFTRSQLIEEALGASSIGFDRTIDTHIWSLRRKIGEPPGQPRVIVSEPGVGYRLGDDGAD